MDKFSREKMKHFAKLAGFHFHDAGYSPVEHTDPLKYSEECFVRLIKMISGEAVSMLRARMDDPDVECQMLQEYFDIDDLNSYEIHKGD